MTKNTPPENKDRQQSVLSIDYELYEKMLEESDATEEEKREFLDVVWNIVVSFVDLGFGVHPLQQACEQALDLSTLNLPDMLDSKGLQINSEFKKATQNNNGDA